MLALPFFSFLTLLYTARVSAVPAPIQSRSVTQLTAGEISTLVPFAQFSRAAYCPLGSIDGWRCGDACDALPGFQPTLIGGNNGDIQNYFVGYWPSENTIVVAHEGTDPKDIMSLLTDLDIEKGELDPALFPGVPPSVLVHEGFRDEHFKTASLILEEVNRLLAEKGLNSVTCVGHSLGGALAQLDALLFTLNLPRSVTIKAVTYGIPRVGNPEYAVFFDSKVPDFQRVNYMHDVIPILPGRFLGFEHPHGEVHLFDASDAIACPGDDDATDSQCQILFVPNIFEGNLEDHLGPYVNVYIGSVFCT